MNSLVSDVTAFHVACDVSVCTIPAVPPPDRKALRIRLIREEGIDELLPALFDGNWVEALDGMGDLIYVIVGAAVEYGLPLNQIEDLPNGGRLLQRPGPSDFRNGMIVLSIERLLKAMETDNLLRITIRIEDAIRAVANAAFHYDLPLADAWKLIQAANMAKVDPATGKVRKREDGKILKPEGWTPPNIAGLLQST